MKPKRWLFGIFSLAFLFIFIYSTAFAQSPTQIVRLESVDSNSFPKVLAYISVTDAQGKAITGLAQDSFSASEDSLPLTSFTVSPYQNTGQPLAISLVIDTSGSMVGDPLSNSVQAAKQFISTLEANDLVGIISFADRATTIQDLTSDRSMTEQALDNLVAVGNTALYDALVEASAMLKNRSERRVIILLTDGQDSGISQFTFDQAVNESVRWTIPVYPIGFGSGVDQIELEKIAKLTGGYAQTNPDSNELTAAFSNVLNNLREQYLLEYISTLQGDGKEHILNVNVNSQGGVASAATRFTANPGLVSISLTEFQNQQEISGNVRFAPQILSPAVVDKLEISIDGGLMTSVLAAPFEYVWDSTSVSTGEHQFDFTVTDKAGNIGSSSLTLLVRSPVIVTTNLIDDQLVSGVVNIVSQVDSPAGIARVEFLIDDQPLGEVVTSPYEMAWDTSKISPGYHTVIARATDVNGNTSETQVRVNVDVQKSSNLIWVAAIAILAACAIILPFAIRRNRSVHKSGVSSGGKGAADQSHSRNSQRAVLIEQDGLNDGHEWPINPAGTNMGRKRDENDIPLKGLSASRFMAMIRLEPEGYLLYSRNPENPVLVNGIAVVSQQVLQPGDTLKAGESTFIFQLKA